MRYERRGERPSNYIVSSEYLANSYAVFVFGDRSVDSDDEKLREFLDR